MTISLFCTTCDVSHGGRFEAALDAQRADSLASHVTALEPAEAKGIRRAGWDAAFAFEAVVTCRRQGHSVILVSDGEFNTDGAGKTHPKPFALCGAHYDCKSCFNSVRCSFEKGHGGDHGVAS